jgi:hypothetical protein
MEGSQGNRETMKGRIKRNFMSERAKGERARWKDQIRDGLEVGWMQYTVFNN